jgi:hypothetical protein
MMDVLETYILPIVGYRCWVLREGKLSSYAVDNFWIPKKANVARVGNLTFAQLTCKAGETMVN